MVEETYTHTNTHAHYIAHASGYKKVKRRQYAPRGQGKLNKSWATKRRGQKVPWEIEALIWESGKKCAAKSIFLAMALWNNSP